MTNSLEELSRVMFMRHGFHTVAADSVTSRDCRRQKPIMLSEMDWWLVSL
jgi:hypothetical protein